MTIKKRKMKPIDYMFLFGILGAICTACVLFYTWRQNRLSSKKSTQTLTNTTEILQENKSLKIQVETQSNKIDELRRENNELSSKLMDKSLDIYNNLTGGDSYCIFEVFFSYKNSVPEFTLRHVGKFPLKNVQIHIEDNARSSFLDKGSNDSDELTKISEATNYHFDFSSLHPNTIITNINIPIESGQKDIKMRIWINSDNGKLFELLEVRNFREKDRKFSLELKRGDKVLYESKN